MTSSKNPPNLMSWQRYGFLMDFLSLALPISAWKRLKTEGSEVQT